MKIDKEKANRIYVEEKTVKEAIIKMGELLDYFELHNKNLTNKQYDNISICGDGYDGIQGIYD